MSRYNPTTEDNKCVFCSIISKNDPDAIFLQDDNHVSFLSIDPNVSATGLGLYVALKMAQQMGGDITCASEGDGKGSTFTFKLPLAM